MTKLLFVVGILSGTILLTLLAATVSAPSLRIWPTPGKGTWQSMVFWLHFRAANVITLLMAALDWGSMDLIAAPVRMVGAVVASVCGVLYVRSYFSLGRPNTYCGRAGLVAEGVYKWTRNPQYVTVIPAYAGLALAADSAMVLALTACLLPAYVLMAFAEEPWLRRAYPGDYERYARRVPRFYNWRRARALLRALIPPRQASAELLKR